MKKRIEFSPEMKAWLERNSQFDAAAFYALTDDEILAEPWTDDDLTLPTWKFVVIDGVIHKIPGRPLKVSI